MLCLGLSTLSSLPSSVSLHNCFEEKPLESSPGLSEQGVGLCVCVCVWGGGVCRLGLLCIPE